MSPCGESPPVSLIRPQTHWSPLSSSPVVRRWLLCSALSLHLTSPLYQLHHSQLHTDLHRATYSIFVTLSLTCLLHPTAAKPVTCRLRRYSKPFPNLPPSSPHHISPIPVTFTLLPLVHSYPLSVLSLPLISPLPLPNHYQFSLTHYLLLAPSLPPPLPLIPPLSIPVSAYPPYISSAFALPSPHLQQHEYIIIYTMGPCLLFMNYQPCGQTKPIFIRNLHFISAPIRLGAKE